MGSYDGDLSLQTSGNTRVTVLNANGNVGIGTAEPGAKLSFNNLDDGSDGADGITWHSAHPLYYAIHRTAGAWSGPDYQQLRLGWETGIILDPGTSNRKSYVDVQGNGLRVTAGNVGIGTTEPGAPLHIKGEQNGAEFMIGRSNRALEGGDIAGHMFIDAPSAIALNYHTNGPIVFGKGNVGLGVIQPDHPLHVETDYANNWQVRFANGSSNVYLARQDGYGIHINTGQQNASIRYGLQVRNAQQTHLFVRDDGNVGIGTEGPGAKLSFNNMNDGSDGADGITWYNGSPLVYGIHRTAGAWSRPDFQQLRLGWDTGIVLDPGTAYGKSYVDVQGNGLRVTAGTLQVAGASILTQQDWQTPTLLNNWVRHSTQYNAPGYFKDSMGVVHLRGLVKNGTASDIFRLPVGYRPARRELLPVCIDPNIGGRVDVLTSGRVYRVSGASGWVSLDGITFRAGSPPRPVTGGRHP